ncbi:hypothetical protein ABK040_013291 [Willaertia magna]
MKRKNNSSIHYGNMSPDKKVKILNEMESTLQQNYQNSTQCNSIMSFSDYVCFFNFFIKYRNSYLFKSLLIDILLQINNFIEIDEKLTMIYICKNWFEKFYNNDYFWKYLLSLLKIENKTSFDTNQIRNFLIFKYKYYNKYKSQERKSIKISSDNSSLDDFDEHVIPISFFDDYYFNGEFKYYSGWYGCGGGSTANTFQTNLFGIYFEPLSLQHIFVKLEINIDYDNGSEESNNTDFSLVAYLEEEVHLKKSKKNTLIRKLMTCDSSDEEKEFKEDIEDENKEIPIEEEEINNKELEIVEMDDDTFIIHLEALRKLVREWLKLSENEIKNEKEWLQNFFENKIPKEAKCKEIFKRWPLFREKKEDEEEEND